MPERPGSNLRSCLRLASFKVFTKYDALVPRGRGTETRCLACHLRGKRSESGVVVTQIMLPINAAPKNDRSLILRLTKLTRILYERYYEKFGARLPMKRTEIFLSTPLLFSRHNLS